MRVNPQRHVIKLVKAEFIRLQFLSRNEQFREDCNRAITSEQEKQVITKWELGVNQLSSGGQWSIASPVQVESADGCWLHLKVNGNHPIADLLPAIEIELARFLNRRPHTEPRTRLDKADFQLAVLDLAMAGYAFSEIAKMLKRSTSTIKGAYASAKRKAFGPGKGESKKELTLKSFDPHKHMQNCPTCQKADRAPQLCRLIRLYANQDYRGQREILGYDTH
ncbi:MAG: hypothetical protein HY695_04950 [Deltaproteobacteria bacterium]|nr:hypothetical protein [Deltaproteobacteria bacterium]